MERPEEVTRFLRCSGMNCDHLCEKGGKVEDCLTWRVHGYVEQLEAQVPKWISVEERLPEYDTIVLVYVTNRSGWYSIETDMFYSGGWLNSPDDEWHHVTHWMFLPEPPTKGEKS